MCYDAYKKLLPLPPNLHPGLIGKMPSWYLILDSQLSRLHILTFKMFEGVNTPFYLFF